MNTNYLKIKIEIPIDYENPDINGVRHTRAAYEKAIQHGCKDIPFVTYDNNGEVVPIGVGDINLTESSLIYDGYIWSGGFGCIVEDVDMSADVLINDMIITGVGFDINVNVPPPKNYNSK